MMNSEVEGQLIEYEDSFEVFAPSLSLHFEAPTVEACVQEIYRRFEDVSDVVPEPEGGVIYIYREGP